MDKLSGGSCRACSRIFSSTTIDRHLRSCGAYAKQEGPAKVFFLKASAGPYWVFLEVEAALTLAKLDNFLRDLWMECCGHVSAFTIGNLTYSSFSEDPQPDERSMNYKIQTMMKPGAVFGYEYDFGTPTELVLACVSEKTGQKGIRIIARNNPPAFTCDECGNPATNICSSCVWDEKFLFCDSCGKKHECGEDMLLPVVNSPRTGMCGFTGDCRLIDA